jgi:peptidoglycan/LPS O-acetylase OafA/YrhL
MPTSATGRTFDPASRSLPISSPTQQAAKPKYRIGALDALRGFAALSVVLGHYTANYHRLYGHTSQLLFSYPWAGFGVTLFFMISGFVILMTAERVARPVDFAWARFSRLYPAYWAAVALTFTVLSVFPLPGRHPSPARGIVNLTMLQGFVGVGHVDNVYWTLEVELCFYAIILCLLLLRRVRQIEFVLMGLVVLGVLNDLFLGRVHGQWLDRVRQVLLLDSAWAFLIGVMLYRSLRGPRAWHAVVIVACLATNLVSGKYLDFHVSAVLASVMFLATRGWLKFLEARALVFLGTISYALYLTHANIGYVVIRGGYAVGLNPNVSVALATCVALLIAVAVAFGVERPAMAFLRNRRPRWLSAPAPAPAQASRSKATPGLVGAA